MAYKSILVHADLSRHAPRRIALAARLAHAHQAHLIGAAMTGVSRLTLENNRGMRGDAVAAMQRLTAGAFDLVFLDPPFDGPWFEPALQAAAKLVPVGGWIYLEAPVAWGEPALEPLHLKLERHLKAGAVHAHLLQRTA